MAVFWLDLESAICEAFSVLSRIMLDQSQFHRTVSMMRHKNVLRKIQIYTYLHTMAGFEDSCPKTQARNLAPADAI